ncbi:MAG: type II toxin-antitoxin system VapC family toxin [Candidatus Thorarchaeota archaeon]
MIFDTDYLIEILRNDKETMKHLKGLLKQPNELFITHVTLWELYQGVYKSSRIEYNLRQTEELIQFFTIIPFNQAIARRFGFLMNELRNKGTPIGVMDTLIASIALEEDLPLVTKNRSHFEKAGIRIAE